MSFVYIAMKVFAVMALVVLGYCGYIYFFHLNNLNFLDKNDADFDNNVICSLETLHHYYQISCCNEDGFTIGSNKNGVSKKPQFCPFCGTKITFINFVKDNNE